MFYWFIQFENWLATTYGFEFVVHFEDSVTFGAGVFIGMLIMAVLSGHVVFKLHKVESLGANKIKLVRFQHEGFKHYIADPQNLGESVETLLLVIFRPLFQIKEYNYRDERRTKIFIIVITIIGIILVILAFISINNIITENLTMPGA